MDELASLMDEFQLQTAKLQGESWSVEFSTEAKNSAVAVVPVPGAGVGSDVAAPQRRSAAKTEATPAGTPVNSPTTGIYYSSPNPGAPPFVSVGAQVEAGQVIGLIEAMKVFNEITATVSGKVLRVVAQNGQLVQPGDPLVYIG